MKGYPFRYFLFRPRFNILSFLPTKSLTKKRVKHIMILDDIKEMK